MYLYIYTLTLTLAHPLSVRVSIAVCLDSTRWGGGAHAAWATAATLTSHTNTGFPWMFVLYR